MKKFLPKLKNNPQGFTLIELLVVISIIAILAVTGIVMYSGVSARGRDTKRIEEITAIQTAMEKDYQPGSATPYQPLVITDFTNNVVPTDPRAADAKCGANGKQACLYCFYPKGTAAAENASLVAGVCTGGTVAAAGVPAVSSGYVVCANLETGAGLAGVYYYCKFNAQ